MVNSVTNVTVQSTNDSNSAIKKEASKEVKSSFKEVLDNTKEEEVKSEPSVKDKGETEDEKNTTDLNELNEKLDSMDIDQIINMLMLLKIDPKDILSLKESIKKCDSDNIKAIISKLVEDTSVQQVKSVVELATNQNLKSIDSNMKSKEQGISDIISNILKNDEVVNIPDKQPVQAKPGYEPDNKQEIIAMLHKRFTEGNLNPNNKQPDESVDLKLNKILQEVTNNEYVKLSKGDLSINTNLAENENLNDSKLNFVEQIPSKSTEKEDKLLKNLIQQDKPKGAKDAIGDKITNVLSRFEVSTLNKPVVAVDTPVVNKASFNIDLIKAVKYMDINNLKELSVKIMPKDLGQMVIRLTMDNGIMKANITATNKETYDLLNSQLPAISKQLSEQNLSIQSFSLSLSNGDNFLFNGNESNTDGQQKNHKKNVGIDAIEDEDLLSEANIQQEGNVNLLA
ncbi:flagellar hook-length control protein FliK [Clostridium sp. YIM B02515]|uniref:Flagellar hook-length control protein FliK n=1 Tax=Clostridium rhizosphaerae TaxID=2803861 RepID=A0ABS1TFB3_9CLOT|nr:flagellar hook-length control protein FliK [Clostridium rhizosphaerae]